MIVFCFYGNFFVDRSENKGYFLHINFSTWFHKSLFRISKLEASLLSLLCALPLVVQGF